MSNNEDLELLAKARLQSSLDDLCKSAGIEDKAKYISIHNTLKAPLLIDYLTRFYLAKIDQVEDSECSNEKILAGLDCFSKKVNELDTLLINEWETIRTITSSNRPTGDLESGIMKISNKMQKIFAISFAFGDYDAICSYEKVYDKLQEQFPFEAANLMINLNRKTPEIFKKYADLIYKFGEDEDSLNQLAMLENYIVFSNKSEQIILHVIDKAYELQEQGHPLEDYVKRASIILRYIDSRRCIKALDAYVPKK